jgi:hypothetical protein
MRHCTTGARVRFTLEEIADAGEGARRELDEQGLPLAVTDPSALAPIIRSFRDHERENREASDPREQ